MIFDADEYAGAVLFFTKDGLISREMLYSEFQAVLDTYVPAMELANQSFRAVYVEVDHKLLVRRAVFFMIDFTAKGFVEASWMLPLEQLARNASKGPDLGAGPINLACASMCPIDHYRSMLWDPDLRSGKGQLGVLKKVMAENRLVIQFREIEEDVQRGNGQSSAVESELSQKLHNQYEKQLRKHMAQLLKEQRLRAKTIANESQRAMDELKKEHNARLNEFRVRLDEKDRQIEEESQRNAILKGTIDGQADKIRGLREYFEHKLDQAQGHESDELNKLKENYQAELKATVEAETKELKELLQMREVELLYRNEQEANLHDEISRLRLENQQLIGNSGDELLGKMLERGVSFVTYQPGAGHITLPVAEVSRFMENPSAYTAQYCGVTEAHYLAWMEHYHAPICRHQDEDGNMCGENINRIEKPIDFHMGESDRCLEHQLNQVKLKLV